MCDTILAAPDSTGEGIMLFGKNSDRQRNEAQTVEFFARAEYPWDAHVKCTYIAIPQARRTHAVLLCRPFWIWGAEMGANEHGVVIGNEGLYARSPAPEQPSLIGMDLLRLALERATSAAEAATVIAELLATHGQGGNCGHLTPSHYHNSYMIADPGEAFVLETVGREWLIERVRGEHAISNDYTIGPEAHRTSAGLSGLLRDFGWQGEAAPNYASLISDRNRSHIGSALERRTRAQSLLGAARGRLSVADIMNALRDHDVTGQCGSEWNPSGGFKYSLCIHSGAENRNVQTTGALASEIRSRDSVHWVTGTASPCTSIFKPVLMDAPLPWHGPLPTDRFDPQSLWWRHERLQRAAALADFGQFLEAIRPERDALEAEFRLRINAVLAGGNAAERSKVVAECWQQALETEERWHANVGHPLHSEDSAYAAGWAKMNQLAGLEL